VPFFSKFYSVVIQSVNGFLIKKITAKIKKIQKVLYDMKKNVFLHPLNQAVNDLLP